MKHQTVNSPAAQAHIQAQIRHYARHQLGRDWDDLGRRERFTAVAHALRDRLVEGMLETQKRQEAADAKSLYYLSMEFLMGRALGNNLHNLGMVDLFEASLGELGEDLGELAGEEPDAALGNGGLGRLAACFLDSLATLDLPGHGYGINYEYGLFRQQIDGGAQREVPDHWLEQPSPWEIERNEEAVIIPLYGRIEHTTDRGGLYNPMWLDWQVVVGVPHDMPVVGYGGRTVNRLRLFSARSSNEFDMAIFNDGDYMQAVAQKIESENISKVLYPSDSQERGRELRLVQEYFLVACSLRDIMRRFLARHDDLALLPDRAAIQLNDTHPTLAIPELMRILVDEHELPWERAWDVTVRTLAYTNHTLLPEALERWPLQLVEKVLPRHLQVIYEINRRFLDDVQARWPQDTEKVRRLSIIEEGPTKNIRMVNLAVVGSHAVNGVAALHTELVKKRLLPDFHDLWPERFQNKTNGVTQRRWLLASNPELAALLNESIGPEWVRDAGLLQRLEPLAGDAGFQERFMAAKRANKIRLCDVIRDSLSTEVDPDSLFDIQVKRIHLYKRQLLNALHVLHLYLQTKESGEPPETPRTFVFAGKAAPGYWAAKQVIRFIHAVAERVNSDPDLQGRLKVVYLPDYRVSLAERIFPAADLSEQISCAGMEASGTGNMKFALNGALTIGTLDGANVEIYEAVGDENIYIFGLEAEEVRRMKEEKSYDPASIYERDPALRRVIDEIASGRLDLPGGEPFGWLVPNLAVGGDDYFHLADFASYAKAQERAGRDFRDPVKWARMAILNVARNGRFSSDRTILEYAHDIWDLKSV